MADFVARLAACACIPIAASGLSNACASIAARLARLPCAHGGLCCYHCFSRRLEQLPSPAGYCQVGTKIISCTAVCCVPLSVCSMPGIAAASERHTMAGTGIRQARKLATRGHPLKLWPGRRSDSSSHPRAPSSASSLLQNWSRA